MDGRLRSLLAVGVTAAALATCEIPMVPIDFGGDGADSSAPGSTAGPGTESGVPGPDETPAPPGESLPLEPTPEVPPPVY